MSMMYVGCRLCLVETAAFCSFADVEIADKAKRSRTKGNTEHKQSKAKQMQSKCKKQMQSKANAKQSNRKV